MNARTLPTDAAVGTVDGERALFLLPAIVDDASPAVREGLARRRLVALGQPCPCGAILALPNRAQRRAARRRKEPIHVTVRHESDCPAGDKFLIPALHDWIGGQ